FACICCVYRDVRARVERGYFQRPVAGLGVNNRAEQTDCQQSGRQGHESLHKILQRFSSRMCLALFTGERSKNVTLKNFIRAERPAFGPKPESARPQARLRIAWK